MQKNESAPSPSSSSPPNSRQQQSVFGPGANSRVGAGGSDGGIDGGEAVDAAQWKDGGGGEGDVLGDDGRQVTRRTRAVLKAVS